jgi:hypothetical protein
VLRSHSYFFDNTVIPVPRFITQCASWISAGLFGAGFEDVTARDRRLIQLPGRNYAPAFGLALSAGRESQARDIAWVIRMLLHPPHIKSHSDDL